MQRRCQSLVISIIGTWNRTSCCPGGIIAVFGKDLFPQFQKVLHTNIEFMVTKVPSLKRATLLAITGKKDQTLLRLPGISNTNGRTRNGCNIEKSTMLWMHHGVFTRFIWQVGCDQIRTTKHGIMITTR